MFDKINKHTFQSVRATLKERLKEKSPALIQLIVGPRQVGKPTLILEIASEWAWRSLYASADTPGAQKPSTFNQRFILLSILSYSNLRYQAGCWCS
jgi:predicted AAA+ superfamily ATPase